MEEGAATAGVAAANGLAGDVAGSQAARNAQMIDNDIVASAFLFYKSGEGNLMLRSVVLPAALGAILLFFFGFIFWASGLIDPWSHLTGTNQLALAEGLRAAVPESGTFFLPDPGGDPEQLEALGATGPWVTLHINYGTPPSNGMILLGGFLHSLVSLLLLAGLLSQVGGGRGRRIMTMLAAVVFLVVYKNYGDPIYFLQPWGFHLYTAIYDLIGLGLAGALICWMQTRRDAVQTAGA